MIQTYDQTEAVLVWLLGMFIVLGAWALLEGAYERWMVRRWLKRRYGMQMRVVDRSRYAVRNTIGPARPTGRTE